MPMNPILSKVPGLSDALPVGASLSLLALRLVVGTAFVLHGLPKLANALVWMGDAVPGPLQALAALAEVAGGAALALGLLTPLAALALAGTMIGAMLLVHLPMHHPFVASEPGGPSGELALVYLTASLVFLFVGPGAISLDAILLRSRPALTSNRTQAPTA